MSPRAYDPSSIPDTGSFFPDGAYEFEIEELSEETSSTNKAMFKGVLRCVGPSMEGVPHFENFVLGSDEDPNADDPNTMKMSIGARSLVRLLKKAGVELIGDLEAEAQAAIGQHVIGVMTSYVEPAEKRGVANQYAGQPRNRVQFFGLGERELGATGGGTASPPAAARRPMAPATRAAAPPAAAPARAAAPRAAAPAAAAPARAAAPPARAAAPVAPARATAPKKTEQMLACQLCPPEANQVPRSEFAAHMAQHEGEE